ncbi:alpha/beta hydrolase [Aureispira sp. CCB-E]|nr:alpha/beta hydrolase [Aureispira sp. CCB-E]WMX13706.1 alpha/beta hydrolase [Aureispira sp. CCB-E]
MPSLSYYIVTTVLRIKGLKKIFAQDPIPYEKLRKEDIHIPSKRVLKGNASTQFKVLNTLVTSLVPKKYNNDQFLLLYCPGGAFVSGPNLLSWDSLAKLVRNTGINAWMLDYPKAPEAKILETTQNIDAVYAKALEQYDASRIILIGDSAGGNLILTLTQRLIAKQQPLPRRLIAISPAFDGSMTNPEIDRVDPYDCMLSKKGVLSAKRMCQGNLDIKDPMLSPLYGSFKNFPPVDLFMGEYDVLYPDQKLGRAKMEQEGVDLNVTIGKKMPHIWPLLPVMKEGVNALKKIEKIILQQIK